VPTSTSEAYLRTHRLQYHTYATVQDGLRALAAGALDAMVYDAPLLRYLVAKELPGRVTVLPNTFERQYYGIALPTGSPWREEINYLLLEKIRQPAWHDLLYRYLGQDDQG
jgi:ABC-type amino acid transport substrate-binding protein